MAAYDRLQGMSGSTLLKHRSTGKCLNAYYLNNGGVVTTWPCNAGDPAQNFNIISVGNGYSLIQRRGSNFCVDSPTRNNGGMVHLWNCDRGIANQRWQNGSTDTTSQATTSQPNFQASEYRNNNIFWNAGYAPGSTNPPNPKLGSALGNCTWYASGRAKQLGRNSARVDRMTGNASAWGNQARAAGIAISSQPQVGAIAQWDSGHVAVVEKVNTNGTIVISESSFGSGRANYLYSTRTIPTNNPSRYILP